MWVSHTNLWDKRRELPNADSPDLRIAVLPVPVLLRRGWVGGEVMVKLAVEARNSLISASVCLEIWCEGNKGLDGSPPPQLLLNLGAVAIEIVGAAVKVRGQGPLQGLAPVLPGRMQLRNRLRNPVSDPVDVIEPLLWVEVTMRMVKPSIRVRGRAGIGGSPQLAQHGEELWVLGQLKLPVCVEEVEHPAGPTCR